MRILTDALTTILLIIIFALGFIYSGIYNISAAKPHSPLFARILSETMENSVRARSSGIKTPPEDDEIRIPTALVKQLTVGKAGRP